MAEAPSPALVASVEHNPAALHPVLEVGYWDPSIPVRGPAMCLDAAVSMV